MLGNYDGFPQELNTKMTQDTPNLRLHVEEKTCLFLLLARSAFGSETSLTAPFNKIKEIPKGLFRSIAVTSM